MDLVPENRECPVFVRDLNSGWQHDNIPECPWSTTIEHLSEMYDLYGVGDVRNVLSLRLFASSIFEIATGPLDSQKLMYTIFGEDLIRKIDANNRQIYEAIELTTQHLAWKICKAKILQYRRTSKNHGWESVRTILCEILKSSSTTDRQIAGMTASILQEVVEANPKTWREDGALLSRSRFPDVFRFAVLVFNDSIRECLHNVNAEIVYEAVAARLAYFYARLAADAWRILVIRNGPKEETEWLFDNSSVEPTRLPSLLDPIDWDIENSLDEMSPSSPPPPPQMQQYKTHFGQETVRQPWEEAYRYGKKIPTLFDNLNLTDSPPRPSNAYMSPNTAARKIYSVRVESL